MTQIRIDFKDDVPQSKVWPFAIAYATTFGGSVISTCDMHAVIEVPEEQIEAIQDDLEEDEDVVKYRVNCSN